jgi:hypothetical protein
MKEDKIFSTVYIVYMRIYGLGVLLKVSVFLRCESEADAGWRGLVAAGGCVRALPGVVGWRRRRLLGVTGSAPSSAQVGG